MDDNITPAEEKFMLNESYHEGESYAHRVIRRNGIVDQKIGTKADGTDVFTKVIIPQYAMDAVVPMRGTREERRGFSQLSPEGKANEIRNAHALANNMFKNPLNFRG